MIIFPSMWYLWWYKIYQNFSFRMLLQENFRKFLDSTLKTLRLDHLTAQAFSIRWHLSSSKYPLCLEIASSRYAEFYLATSVPSCPPPLLLILLVVVDPCYISCDNFWYYQKIQQQQIARHHVASFHKWLRPICLFGDTSTEDTNLFLSLVSIIFCLWDIGLTCVHLFIFEITRWTILLIELTKYQQVPFTELMFPTSLDIFPDRGLKNIKHAGYVLNNLVILTHKMQTCGFHGTDVPNVFVDLRFLLLIRWTPMFLVYQTGLTMGMRVHFWRLGSLDR